MSVEEKLEFLGMMVGVVKFFEDNVDFFIVPVEMKVGDFLKNKKNSCFNDSLVVSNLRHLEMYENWKNLIKEIKKDILDG